MFSILKRDEGIALVTALVVGTIISLASAAYLSQNVNEGELVSTLVTESQALYLAEMGIQDALWRIHQGTEGPFWTTVGTTVSMAGGSYTISVQDDLPNAQKIIRVNGDAGGEQVLLKVTQPVFVSSLPENNYTTGNDLDIFLWRGFFWKTGDIYVQGKARVAGNYNPSGHTGHITIDDCMTGVPAAATTIVYPDVDGDGTPNEYEDFALYYRNLVENPETIGLAPSEVVHEVISGGSLGVGPRSYDGKKLVFVERTYSGDDVEAPVDVDILFSAMNPWQNGNDLTIVATGDIIFGLPTSFSTDSRISLVAYDDFLEILPLKTNHETTIVALDHATFIEAFINGSMLGNTLANDDISVYGWRIDKDFLYSDRMANGDFAPGLKLPVFANQYVLLRDGLVWERES